MIFKIGQEEADGTSKEFCEIAAGIPVEEYGPDLRANRLSMPTRT